MKKAVRVLPVAVNLLFALCVVASVYTLMSGLHNLDNAWNLRTFSASVSEGVSVYETGIYGGGRYSYKELYNISVRQIVAGSAALLLASAGFGMTYRGFA